MTVWSATARDLAACFAVALALAAALTPAMARLASALGAVDRPGARKPHRRPTPLLGGLAILLGFWIAVLWLAPRTPSAFASPEFLAAAVLVALVGLWDDLSRLPVWVRLVAQIAAAVPVMAAVGVAELALDPRLEITLTALWIVGVTNALNLLDNIDGAASAVAAAAAISYAALVADDVSAAAAALALAGAAIGFLLFNFPPARLFMGDAGSFFLGLTLAVLGLEAQHRVDHRAGWIPALVILALPLFDTTLVTISRLRRGKNPLTTPGRDHFAHRLGRRGWSDRKIVAVFAAATAWLGVAAFLAAADAAVAWGVGAVVLALAAVALVWLEG